MVAPRQTIRMVEEFEDIDFSLYTVNQATTDDSGMGRTPGISETWGLNTQRHIDVRTFADGASWHETPEHWVMSPNGTHATGLQGAYNKWPGLTATLASGTTSFTSSASSLDLTALGETALLTVALPSLPTTHLTLGQCYLDLSNDAFATTVVSLPFSSSTTSVSGGYATWPISSVTGINLAAVTDVRLRFTATSGCSIAVFAIRVIDPNWVAKDVDMDNWNGLLRQCIPLDANTAELPVPNNQVLPSLWRSADIPGVNDPQPINGTWAAVFFTGSQTGYDTLSLNLRAVNGTDTSQLSLANQIQAQLNGPQPGLTQASLAGRTVGDLDVNPIGTLDSETMGNMDAVGAFFSQSWLQFSVTWGLIPSVSITRSTASTDYQWSGSELTFTNGASAFQNNTHYLALFTLTDTTAELQVYTLNQTNFAIGSLLFDTGQIEDSYRFIRRGGYVGWKATLQDGDAGVRSLRPESLMFAEYLSAQLNSNTPVRGVQVYAVSSPPTQFWQDWTPVGPGITLTPDSRRSTSGQSTRSDIALVSSGQGLISNVLTPPGDPISGVTNWNYAAVNFDLWFSSAALNQGATLSPYLISQDGNKVPLAMPEITPDLWQTVEAYPPPGLQSGRYQLGISYTGPTTTFWIDSPSVEVRTITWSARSHPSDQWLDLRDEVNDKYAGGVFVTAGSQLQVQAQALSQGAAILSAPKVVPVYAQLGRFVWPEQAVADPVSLSGSGFTTSGSTHGSPITFTSNVHPTPAGSIINWLWAFGDGSSANGPVAKHTYAFAGTYTATLTIVDLYGQRTAYNSTLSVT